MSDNIFTEIYNKILGLFGQTVVKDESKNTAVNRLRLVLMQDRTNLTPEIMHRMRSELIEVLSKYVELDKEALELNFESEGEQMALMLSIPVLRAKDEGEIQETLKKEDEAKAKAEEADSGDNEEEEKSDESNDVSEGSKDEESVDETSENTEEVSESETDTDTEELKENDDNNQDNANNAESDNPKSSKKKNKVENTEEQPE